MVAGILMSIAEYERELVRERTALKLEHARKSGRKFGRPAKLTADQAALARRMKANGETAATICETLGIGRTTSLPLPGRGRRSLIDATESGELEDGWTQKGERREPHRQARDEGRWTARHVAKYLGVSRATLYRDDGLMTSAGGLLSIARRSAARPRDPKVRKAKSKRATLAVGHSGSLGQYGDKPNTSRGVTLASSDKISPLSSAVTVANGNDTSSRVSAQGFTHSPGRSTEAGDHRRRWCSPKRTPEMRVPRNSGVDASSHFACAPAVLTSRHRGRTRRR